MSHFFERAWKGEAPAWIWLLMLSATIFAFRMAGRHPIATQEDTAHLLVGDPPMGRRYSYLAMPTFDRTFVMVLSSCVCNVEKAEHLAKAITNPHVGLRLLITMPLSEIRKVYPKLPAKVAVTADPGFDQVASLNATFLPRSYELDSSGGLIWKQNNQHLSPQQAFQEAEKATELREVRS